MSAPPLTIFAPIIDPSGILELVRDRHPDAYVEEGERGWRLIRVIIKRGLFRKSLVLELKHDPDYYLGPDWNQQITGMRGYFAQFPMDDAHRERVMDTISHFCFTLATMMSPDADSEEDPRLALFWDIVAKLKGYVFTPGALLDSAGRLLIDADGQFDEQATFWSVEKLGRTVERGEDEEPEPPVPSRVVQRALVLAAVVGRGFLEMHAEQGESDLSANLPKIRQWLIDVGVRHECEPQEWNLFTTPVGELADQAVVDSIWRSEGLAILTWALGLAEAPSYDQLTSVEDLLARLGFLDQTQAQIVIGEASLRAPEELERMSEELLAFHWRMRDFSLRPVSMDFEEFGRSCWFGPIDLDWATLVDKDLALDGVAIINASSDIISRCQSAAMERHKAINWLQGYSTIYSEISTDT